MDMTADMIISHTGLPSRHLSYFADTDGIRTIWHTSSDIKHRMEIVEKIRQLRQAEGLSQDAFAREIGMNVGTLRNYESGRRKSISSTELQKITGHSQFKKYALWLVTGETAPEAGQISPEIEDSRQSKTG